MLLRSESWVKKTVQDILKKEYGDNWEIKGLPRPIYKRAKDVADEQNYDSIAAGDNTHLVEIWDCITLKDCKEIATVGSHWTELFESKLTRPEETKRAGGKAEKTKWMEQVESIQNKLNMTSYSVTAEEFNFLKELYTWLSAQL